MGQFANSSAQATNYGIQANEARLQGMLQKKQAYANAYKLEGDSRMQGEVVGENMMRASANAVARLAAARTAQAGSGFADVGSKLRAEQSTAEVLMEALANMRKSYAISDQNARNQANVYRREGDTAYELGQIQGNMYDKMARAMRKASRWQLVGGALQMVGQMGSVFNFGGDDKKQTGGATSLGGGSGSGYDYGGPTAQGWMGESVGAGRARH